MIYLSAEKTIYISNGGIIMMGYLIFLVMFIFFYVVFKLILDNKKFIGKSYDERQLQIRANAYKYSFFTVIFLLVLFGGMYGFAPGAINKIASHDMVLFTIMYAGVTVFSVYSVVKDAFFSIDNKKSNNGYLILITIVLIINAVCLITHIIDGTLIGVNGISFTEGGACILNVFTFGSIIITIIIKSLCNKKEMAD